MSKYLNGDGLSHLMTTIKNAIAATVTGVKGNAESSYRTGQVNITATNVGAVAKSGDTMTGMLTAPMIKTGRTVQNVVRYIYSSTAKETVIWTGIKYRSSTHMPVVKLNGYAYGAGKTTELRIALYIYKNEFYSSRTVTNLGVWNPKVYLFAYTKNDVEYVAIGLEGSIYYNMFSVDVQDEMSNFSYIDIDGWTVNGYADTGHIPAIGTNHCVSVNYGIDILNPPKVNGHTVATDVPADAVFTDTKALGSMTGTLGIDHGGTGATSASDARTSLGVPPASHASSATTYGTGSSSDYGHVKLSDSTSASTDATGGTAATPKAVKAAYDLANTANTTAGQAMSAATGALAFKVTYSVEDGAVTCYAHVYSAGSEVTENYEDECFDWSMTLDGGTSWVVLGTGKEMPLTVMTAFGGSVKCDFTPPES